MRIPVTFFYICASDMRGCSKICRHLQVQPSQSL